MVNIWTDPITGKEYEEQTTSSVTQEDGTVVVQSTWILIEPSEDKSAHPTVKNKIVRFKKV